MNLIVSNNRTAWLISTRSLPAQKYRTRGSRCPMAQRTARLKQRGIGPRTSSDELQADTSRGFNLLTRKEVPAWYTQNNLVKVGYRPVTGSVAACVSSLGYVHNETVNIYSHLIPAVLALAANTRLHVYFSEAFPHAAFADRLIFHIYLATSSVCFSVSSLYHILLCHSESYSRFWVRIDYATIILQILGSFISGIYLGFYCEPGLQKVYWTMVSNQLQPQ